MSFPAQARGVHRQPIRLLHVSRKFLPESRRVSQDGNAIVEEALRRSVVAQTRGYGFPYLRSCASGPDAADITCIVKIGLQRLACDEIDVAGACTTAGESAG